MKQTNRQFVLSMIMLGALFFIFGLVSWVNSILVPYFKVACELQTDVQSYLVTFAFYIAYSGFFPSDKGGIQEGSRNRLVDLGCRSIVLLAGCADTLLRNVPCGSLHNGNSSGNSPDSR